MQIIQWVLHIFVVLIVMKPKIPRKITKIWYKCNSTNASKPIVCCKKQADRTEYGEPYCHFRFLLDFKWTWSIEFVELAMVESELVSLLKLMTHVWIGFTKWIYMVGWKIVICRFSWMKSKPFGIGKVCVKI